MFKLADNAIRNILYITTVKDVCLYVCMFVASGPLIGWLRLRVRVVVRAVQRAKNKREKISTHVGFDPPTLGFESRCSTTAPRGQARIKVYKAMREMRCS